MKVHIRIFTLMSATLILFSSVALPTIVWASEYLFPKSVISARAVTDVIEQHAGQASPLLNKNMTLSCYLRDSSGYFWYDTLKVNFKEHMIDGKRAVLERNIFRWSDPDLGSKSGLIFSYDIVNGRYKGTDIRGKVVFEGECEHSPLFD